MCGDNFKRNVVDLHAPEFYYEFYTRLKYTNYNGIITDVKGQHHFSVAMVGIMAGCLLHLIQTN